MDPLEEARNRRQKEKEKHNQEWIDWMHKRTMDLINKENAKKNQEFV